MTDQEPELDLSVAQEVVPGVPSSDVDELDQEIETQDTDDQDDKPGADDEPVVPIDVPAQGDDPQALDAD
jgi:hypothetical protein